MVVHKFWKNTPLFFMKGKFRI